LLGTGDAGKSTFVRQIKVMHNNGFSNKEIEKYRFVLQENTLTSMQKILFCDTAKPKALIKEVKAVLEATDLPSVHAEVQRLWQDPTVQEAYENRVALTIQVPSTAPYFFENATRFADPNWMPTNEDMFRAKLKTTGISETVFTENDLEFTLIDVGGQRSERRKWLHCFDDVTAVIYLAALDEYNMTLEEDNQTNRLEESLKLFSEVTGSHFFKPVSWILFLNKSDLFRERIKQEPLNKFFEDIPEEDGQDFEKCCDYIIKRYQEAFQGSKQYTYITCALDYQNCKRVFGAIKDTVISQALQQDLEATY